MRKKSEEQLMALDEWLDWRFVNPPKLRTGQRWCSEGLIPCKRVGKLWFVIVNLELLQTGDPIADEMISDVLRAA